MLQKPEDKLFFIPSEQGQAWASNLCGDPYS